MPTCTVFDGLASTQLSCPCCGCKLELRHFRDESMRAEVLSLGHRNWIVQNTEGRWMHENRSLQVRIDTDIHLMDPRGLGRRINLSIGDMRHQMGVACSHGAKLIGPKRQSLEDLLASVETTEDDWHIPFPKPKTGLAAPKPPVLAKKAEPAKPTPRVFGESPHRIVRRG